MPQRIIGIDIGSYSVKIAEVVRGFRSFEFVGFYERRIQYNELLSPEESIAIALQGLLDDHHVTFDSCITNFPSSRISSRMLTFPFGSQKKIDQAIDFELEGQIPFEASELVLDYSVVWSTKEASRVLALYALKKDFSKYLTMLTNIGIDPRAVSGQGVDLINLVALGMVPPEAPYAIIDIGHEATTISICRGRQLAYVRGISIAGKAITQAIVEKLHVSLDEAERMKIEMGQLSTPLDEMDETTRSVVEAIHGVLESLLIHLRQTFFTYRDMEGTAIEGVYLCGGTSRIPGMDWYFSDKLKQNIAYLNCTDFHFCKLERADAHRHVVAEALALALKGVAPGGAPDVNFRRDEFAFKGDVEEIGGSVRHVAIAFGAVIALALISFTTNYYSLTAKQKKMEEDVKALVKQALPDVSGRSLKTPMAAQAALKAKEAEIQDRKTKLESLVRVSPLDVFKEISTILPGRTDLVLDIDKLNISQERVIFSGFTDSFEAVDRIKLSLQKSKMFRGITPGNVRKGVKGEIKFDLSLDLQKEEGV
ncbi:MAG: pilus assembly protein PilM [Deltaproteobacteria bacterium]|nr:pilus assembly protein PilM [Deltaproteobacteria bacterium]